MDYSSGNSLFHVPGRPAMTQLNIEPLHEGFGARVTGTALSGGLSDGEVALIRCAIDTYSVLCFPDQDMSDEKQLAFTRLLGEPEAEHVTFGKTGRSAQERVTTALLSIPDALGSGAGRARVVPSGHALVFCTHYFRQLTT